MKKLTLYVFLVLMLFINNAGASCDDKPGDGVDYSSCQFADGQDLNGTYMPNANLSFQSFLLQGSPRTNWLGKKKILENYHWPNLSSS